MAEALLRRIDSEHFEAFSAGTSVGQLHPLAVEVMKEAGIDLKGKKPGRIQELVEDRFDYIITLDEAAARSQCRPQAIDDDSESTETIHWKVDDVLASSEPEKQVLACRRVRDQIAQRLRLFVIVNVRSRTPRMSSARPLATSAR
jgi:protein-tyrosine-phosphatase